MLRRESQRRVAAEVTDRPFCFGRNLPPGLRATAGIVLVVPFTPVHAGSGVLAGPGVVVAAVPHGEAARRDKAQRQEAERNLRQEKPWPMRGGAGVHACHYARSAPALVTNSDPLSRLWPAETASSRRFAARV